MNEINGKRIYYFTVATKPHPGLDMLRATCQHHDVYLDVHGMSDQRLQNWGDNLWVKLDYLSNILKGLSSDTIVLFTDAYDVLCGAPLSLVVQRFLKFNHPIVFSAENNCFPEEFKDTYTAQQRALLFPYLNSGTMMGYVWAFRDMLKRLPNYKSTGNDQKYCQLARQKIPDLIILDHQNELFVCAANVPHQRFQFRNGHLYYTLPSGETKNVGFLHVNGRKHDLPNLYKRWKKSIGNSRLWVRWYSGAVILLVIFVLILVLKHKSK